MHDKIQFVQYAQMKNTAHNIYIHVPFCMSKCNYCAFFSHACQTPDWEEYTNKICTEIEYWGNKLGKIDIPTVFFGGGTPSLIPIKCFESIINKIKNCFTLDSNTEITIEANPKTLDKTKLQDFCKSGVNRLSVGIQSLDDNKLKFLGRRHNTYDAMQLLEFANQQNLKTSADFIYGLPKETAEDVAHLCTEINKLGLKHCSLYELTIEENTPFGKMNLQMPDNNTMASMYITIQEKLNLKRYEVSNYAENNDNQCAHNSNIWDGQPYIGIGRGAAGRIFLNNHWFEQRGNNEAFNLLTPNERAIEIIITGIRTKRGCKINEEIKKILDINWIEKNSNLVKIQDNRICATDDGILILDELTRNLIK